MHVRRDGDLRWPLTSCAHRLRKPHHADEPLTPAVTRRPRRQGILPLPRRRPWIRRQSVAPWNSTASGPVDPIACLRQWHRLDRSAFHRIAPGLAARVGWFAIVVKRSRSSPSTRLLAASQADPVKGWLVASNYPSSADPPCDAPSDCEKDASHRLLQPTYATSTPTDDSIPGLPMWGKALRPCFNQLKSFGGRSRLGTTRVELRLTAILQLRQRSRPSLRGSGAVELRSRARRWRRPVLAGAAIGSPSERRRPAAVFSTASRARDTTSDALCRARRASGRSPFARREPGPLPPASRQRHRLDRTRAPSI